MYSGLIFQVAILNFPEFTFAIVLTDMPYKIELRYFYGWDDADWTEDSGEESKPMRFANIPEAEEALNEFFEHVKAAVLAGNVDSEANRQDYRIVRVAT